MANWHLYVCGINHKSSTLDQREPLQLIQNELSKANAVFGNTHGVMESAIISTCNRVEFYFVADQSHEPFSIVEKFYREYKKLDILSNRGNFYIKKDKHTADHLFRVAAGVDSMIVGENQIVGQLKDAYSSACAVKTTGKVIHRLFHQAFRTGKLVRTDTEMGKGSCSVSSAAVELLKLKIPEIESPKILFVGINQMIALAANGLNNIDGRLFFFANRTEEKAIHFARKFENASGLSLDEMPTLLPDVDIVITCTGATQSIITQEMIDNALAVNHGRKLLIMDLAVPRDTEIGKDYHPKIKLYDLEDIHEFVKAQQEKREQAIPEAEAIIERKLSEYMYWFGQIHHEPVYNGLDGSFEAIRIQEITPLLDKLSPEMKEQFEDVTKRLVTRLLHIKIRTSTDSSKSE
jgi:glutamyl-tRNA reductase